MVSTFQFKQSRDFRFDPQTLAGSCYRTTRYGVHIQEPLDRFSGGGLLIIVHDRAEAPILGEQRVAAIAEQVQVERLVALSLAVTLDLDCDRFRRLARGEGDRACLGDVVAVAGLRGAVHSGIRHRYRLVVGGRE